MLVTENDSEWWYRAGRSSTVEPPQTGFSATQNVCRILFCPLSENVHSHWHMLSSYLCCRPKQSSSRNLGPALIIFLIKVQCISSPVPVAGSLGPDRDLSCRLVLVMCLFFLRSLQGYIYMASQLGFWPFPSLIGWHCLARQRPAKTMINWTQIENYPSWWIDVRRTLEKRVGVWCKSNKVTRYWLTQILTHKCANAPNKMDYMFPIWYSNGDIFQ